MGQAGFHIGWIPYFNLHPLYREIVRSSAGQWPVMTGHPTTVNRWLSDGVVALAPSSSITLLRQSHLDVALPLGVASDGPVQSVYIGLHREHAAVADFIKSRQRTLREMWVQGRAMHGDDTRKLSRWLCATAMETRPFFNTLPKIVLTPASAASVALCKVMCSLWFGRDAASQMFTRSVDYVGDCKNDFIQGNRPMELVIGDEALARRPEFSSILDLGQVWHDMTSLPFVFAIWQTSMTQVPQGLRSMIMNAASLASAKMRVEPQFYMPDQMPHDSSGAPLDLASYWKVIQYKLTPRHLQGLLLYLCLYSRLFEEEISEATGMRIAKWNSQWVSVDDRGHSYL